MIFEDRKINPSCLFVCNATLRLLLNVSNVLMQRFIFSARFIGPSFNSSLLVYTGYRVILSRAKFASTYGFALAWICPHNVVVKER